jgi:hypothetical protein
VKHLPENLAFHAMVQNSKVAPIFSVFNLAGHLAIKHLSKSFLVVMKALQVLYETTKRQLRWARIFSISTESGNPLVDLSECKFCPRALAQGI